MRDSHQIGPAIALILLAGSAVAGELTPQETRGKQIYFQGTSPRGAAITALLGADGIRLPASAVTCAGCHGADGRGRPEAGVIPSDITWNHLLKPYGHRHVMGRSHPAFTESTLKQAIVAGHDPAGHRLDTSMPVYDLTDADLDDLLAYLKKLEGDLDPGLSETAIRIGTLLPVDGRLAAIGRGVQEVLGAYFDRVNGQGGFYGRRLELIVAECDGTPESVAAAAESLSMSGVVFTLLSPIVAGAEAELSALAEDSRLPVIGPLTLLSPDSLALNDFTFYLYAGVREQVRVLVDYAARELALQNPRIALVGENSRRYRDAARAVAEQRAVHSWDADPPIELADDTDPSAAASRLAADRIDVLLALGRADLGDLLAAGEKIGWRPVVLLPSAFADARIFDLPATAKGRIHLAYPTLPSDITRAAAEELRVLTQHESAKRHLTSQISALTAAKILAAALKDAGRELSRDKLLRSLENLHSLETGLAPPVTYGANRRVGALGAYVVAVNPTERRFLPVGGWRTPQKGKTEL